MSACASCSYSLGTFTPLRSSRNVHCRSCHDRRHTVMPVTLAHYRAFNSSGWSDLGSRVSHLPESTQVKKSSRVRWKSAGSSKFTVCPVFGNTARAAGPIVRFSHTPGSTHGSSSSPSAISVGTASCRRSDSSSNSDGRVFCTPRNVIVAPKLSCSESCCTYCCHPIGSLFCN